jgi:hypothetical protein
LLAARLVRHNIAAIHYDFFNGCLLLVVNCPFSATLHRSSRRLEVPSAGLAAMDLVDLLDSLGRYISTSGIERVSKDCLEI